MHGFGAAMTDASAELFSRLPAAKRRALMTELFGRANGGLGLSFMRVTVGASDFSRTHYSYDDTPGNAPDPGLRYFSIAPARQYVLPRVREALAINPALKVMISPWSAPAWMKTTKSLIKGQLEPRYYPAFANYLARTVEEFGGEGVPVSMLTIQNEPDFEPGDYPGMRVDPPERAIIIGRHVGPTFKARGLKTQILDYDHNWDNPEMPLAVLADPVTRSFISGVAWHCYEGDVPAQTPVHDAYPNKDAWETECSGGEWAPKFGETLGWMADKLIIGAANNWARGSLLWNLALDPAHGPHHGGCGDCRGVITIDPASSAITRNVEYYVLGHASRFVLPGAYRVAVKHGDGIEAAAFLNPDGSKVAILHRKSGEASVTIAIDGERYSVPLAAGSVATLRWARSAR
jgi:glucosylceramidase